MYFNIFHLFLCNKSLFQAYIAKLSMFTYSEHVFSQSLRTDM